VFDEFLVNSNATTIAKYVSAQQAERSLSKVDVAKLSDVFSKTPPFSNVRIAAIDTPEAISYGREFITALRSQRQKVNGKNVDDKTEFGVPETARLYSPKMHGLYIGVKRDAQFPQEAIRFSQLMSQSGFGTEFVAWDGMPENEFAFVVGPK